MSKVHKDMTIALLMQERMQYRITQQFGVHGPIITY